MKTIAIIPIRSGSKRFPGKNFSAFNETNLIENTIEKLTKARIDYIFISADKESIERLKFIKINKRDNLTCLTRKDILAQDESKIEDVILNVIESESIKLDEDYIIILSQVTTPNWSPHVLTYALHKLDKIDSIVSVSPNYQPNGAFYIIKKSTFLNYKKLFLPNMYLIKLDWEDSIDIDYEHQLYIAQALSRGNHDE